MKVFLITFFLVTLTILTFSQTEEDNVQFGLGVCLSGQLSVYTDYGGPTQFQIISQPINMANFTMIIKGSFFRFEPSIGYSTISINNSSAGYSSELSNSNLRLGAVIAFNSDAIESVNFYYGLNFGFILNSYKYSSSSSNGSSDDSKIDFFIGPAAGGEYMFNRHFSLGGEINLNYISFGYYESDSDNSSWAISTRGLIFLRWYVN
jgi:hypothetical protein